MTTLKILLHCGFRADTPDESLWVTRRLAPGSYVLSASTDDSIGQASATASAGGRTLAVASASPDGQRGFRLPRACRVRLDLRVEGTSCVGEYVTGSIGAVVP